MSAPQNLVASLSVLMALVLALPLAAGEQKIVLREQLGQQWDHELLTYRFSFKPGECVADSVTLTGPQGAMPVQLIGVDYWPDTESVKAAQVAFVDDLAPLATNDYTVAYGPKAATSAVPAADLKIVPAEGSVEITTGKFGLRLLLGEKKYEPAAAAAEVPGPVLGKVVIRYTYEDGVVSELVVQLAAGNAHTLCNSLVTPWNREAAVKDVTGAGWAEGEQRAAETAVQDGWQLLLSPGLPGLPDLLLKVRPYPEPGTTGLASRWGGLKRDKYGNPLPDPAVVEVSKEKPGVLVRLMPWAGWGDRMDLTSFIVAGGGGDVLFACTRDGGDWIESAPFGVWASYGNVRQRHKRVPLMRAEDGTVYLQFNAASGVRKWQLGAVETSKWLDPYAFDLNSGVVPRGIWPLNRVKDLVLDWPQDQGSHPRLFFTAADLQRYRAAHPDIPASAAQYPPHFKLYRNVPSYDSEPLTAYLKSGSKDLADEFKLVERPRTYLGNLGRMDRMRSASLLACLYDALADSGLLSAPDRRLFQAQMAYLAYMCADPGNWSIERGFASGNLNMSTAHILNQGVPAATIPEHPLL